MIGNLILISSYLFDVKSDLAFKPADETRSPVILRYQQQRSKYSYGNTDAMKSYVFF